MRHYYPIPLALLSVLFLAGPALAENPLVEVRPFNVRRLLVTNGCHECDLSETNLSGAHLIGADLRGADLRGADLSWTNLEGADLTKANLTGADLTGAFLTNASLNGANLDNANLSRAQLYYVNVTGASLDNINLAGATVVGTPISVGGMDPVVEGAPPVISPEEVWQLHPPNESQPLWDGQLLDVPLQIVPRG